jgi:hypothetical protein
MGDGGAMLEGLGGQLAGSSDSTKNVTFRPNKKERKKKRSRHGIHKKKQDDARKRSRSWT